MLIDYIVEHKAKTAEILISSTLDEDPENESWGFRAFSLIYEAAPACAIFYSECNY